MSMKILFINSVCGIRSTGRICTDLAQELEAQGHEVKIAYGRENVPEKYQKYAVRIGNDTAVKINGMKARLFDNEGQNAVSETKAFIDWVKQYDPDVIHLHNIHGYYLNYQILFEYLRTCGKRIIWTLHDCWAFTGHTAYCDAIGCEKWKTGCGSCPQIREYPKAYSDRSKKNWEDKKSAFVGIPNLTIVTPSDWLAGLIKESFLKEYPVKVIHNGIDTSQFKPLPNDFKHHYGIEGKKILLGVATTWDENKGYSDYLKLADMVGNEYRVVLVGVTEEQKEKLPSNVLGICRTNSVKELAYIYSAADVLLNLSKTENYPTVILEAVSCGIPCVSYDVGGSGEIADVVVPKGDLAAVAEELKKEVTRSGKMVFDKKAAANEYSEILVGGGVLEN